MAEANTATGIEPTANPGPAPAAEPAAAGAKPAAMEGTVSGAAAHETGAPPAANDLSKEEEVGDSEVKIEAQPVAAGNLGYKAPGLIKQFRFVTKYFWLGAAPLDENALFAYTKSEKTDSAHANAAFAFQTGKGLLLFAKREDDKGAPAGILNLADASDLVKESGNDFSFKVSGHKHTFQAASSSTQDSWIVAIQKAIEEAAPLKEGIIGSEAYKNKLAYYTKPATGGTAGAGAVKTAVTPHKSQDKTPETGSQIDAKAGPGADVTPKAEKSRSRSRKRASIFGKVLGKKEEADEPKDLKREEKETKKEERREEKAIEKTEKAEERKEAEGQQKTADEEKKIEKAEKEETKKTPEVAPVAGAGASGASNANAETSKTVPETPSASTDTSAMKSKRTSIFGGLGMFGRKDKEAAAPKKEENATTGSQTKPVTDAAPQLDPVDTAIPSDTAPTTTAGQTDASVEPVTSSPKTDKVESKGGLRGLFKNKEIEAKTDAADPKPTEPVAESSTAVTDAPAADTTTAGTPTTAGNLKDRRRSSFFGTITGRKDRKSVEPRDRKPEIVSESEMPDSDGKKTNKLQGLFRKTSKSVKTPTGPKTDPSAPPAPPKDVEAKPVEGAAPMGTEAAAPSAEPVVPETTETVGKEIAEPSTESASAQATSPATVTASA